MGNTHTSFIYQIAENKKKVRTVQAAAMAFLDQPWPFVLKNYFSNNEKKAEEDNTWSM